MSSLWFSLIDNDMLLIPVYISLRCNTYCTCESLLTIPRNLYRLGYLVFIALRVMLAQRRNNQLRMTSLRSKIQVHFWRLVFWPLAFLNDVFLFCSHGLMSSLKARRCIGMLFSLDIRSILWRFISILIMLCLVFSFIQSNALYMSIAAVRTNFISSWFDLLTFCK